MPQRKPSLHSQMDESGSPLEPTDDYPEEQCSQDVPTRERRGIEQRGEPLRHDQQLDSSKQRREDLEDGDPQQTSPNGLHGIPVASVATTWVARKCSR